MTMNIPPSINHAMRELAKVLGHGSIVLLKTTKTGSIVYIDGEHLSAITSPEVGLFGTEDEVSAPRDQSKDFLGADRETDGYLSEIRRSCIDWAQRDKINLLFMVKSPAGLSTMNFNGKFLGRDTSYVRAFEVFDKAAGLIPVD